MVNLGHLSDGALRRMYDEPEALTATARGHYGACAACQARFQAIAETAGTVQAALATPAAAVDARPALERVRAARPVPGRFAALGRLRLGGPASALRRPVLAGGLAVAFAALAVVGAVAIAPVFAPTQVQVVPLTAASVQGLPDLGSWGDMKVTRQPEVGSALSAADAAQATGLPVLRPGALPAGIAAPTYATVSAAAGSFTFSSAKAAAAAQAAGKPAPRIPANVDGATLYVTGGPLEAAIYGGNLNPATLAGSGSHSEKAPAMPGEGTVPAAPATAPAAGAGRGTSIQLPQLVVIVARAPSVTSSNGVTVRQIEDAVLAQPGVSPDLAAAVRSIGDPGSTLPIPIPVDRATTDTVTLHDGTRATFVGDNTGLGAGVIFVRGGLVYAVAGTGTATEASLVAIANTL